MWQDKLKEIIYLLENSEINEIEASFWGRKYRVVKKPTMIAGGTVAKDGDEENIISESATPKIEQIDTPPHTDDSEMILSPMPGTFFSASSPDSPKFVKVGDKVTKGDTLCIIEAMKIMNEIEAEKDGLIKSILIDDGQPVEYNQPLFELG